MIENPRINLNESRTLSDNERDLIIPDVVSQFKDVLTSNTKTVRNAVGDLSLDNQSWQVMLYQPTEEHPYTDLQVTKFDPSDISLSQETARIIIDEQLTPDFSPSIWIENMLKNHIDRPLKPVSVNDTESINTANHLLSDLNNSLKVEE